MSTEGGLRAVIAAMIANAGIAVSKFAAFLLTGSSSMLSEAIHSLADTANEALLLLGNRRSRQAADKEHPFGYGRVRYVYAFLVSMVLFVVGGVVSLLEGRTVRTVVVRTVVVGRGAAGAVTVVVAVAVAVAVGAGCGAVVAVVGRHCTVR